MKEKTSILADISQTAKGIDLDGQIKTPLVFDANTRATSESENIKFKQKHLYSFIKRIFDFIASLLGVIILSPLMITIAVIVKGFDGGPVFFKQKRIGKNGKEFTMYKFRSMVPNAEEMVAGLQDKNEASGPMFKMKDDPRITKIGKFIRRTSIDELPQLFNVLNGSMSLVGPRPALPKEVAQYTSKQTEKLLIKPGITCIWQVSGRSEVPFEKQVEMDIYYAEHRSVCLDIKLLFKTIPAVLTHKGAE
jgi:exopolysaccharide biosynthesis polyprenyl glycosylphosphotransferase